MMSVHEFRDEDAAYLKWTSQHRGGYTINIQRTLNPSNARLHRADCRTVSGSNPRNGPWTSHYIKVCANDIAELDAWATAHGLGAIGRCAVCHPTQQTAATRDSTPRGAAPPIPVPSVRATAVRDPSPEPPSVEVWADEYVHFERRTAWQDRLRADLRARVRLLRASPEEVLHATFFGPKPRRADIENLTLYNIDETGAAFSDAARFGLRFELGANEAQRQRTVYGYRYELTPEIPRFSTGASRGNWLPGTGSIWAASPVTRSLSRSGLPSLEPASGWHIRRCARALRSRFTCTSALRKEKSHV